MRKTKNKFVVLYEALIEIASLWVFSGLQIVFIQFYATCTVYHNIVRFLKFVNISPSPPYFSGFQNYLLECDVLQGAIFSPMLFKIYMPPRPANLEFWAELSPVC